MSSIPFLKPGDLTSFSKAKQAYARSFKALEKSDDWSIEKQDPDQFVGLSKEKGHNALVQVQTQGEGKTTGYVIEKLSEGAYRTSVLTATRMLPGTMSVHLSTTLLEDGAQPTTSVLCEGVLVGEPNELRGKHVPAPDLGAPIVLPNVVGSKLLGNLDPNRVFDKADPSDSSWSLGDQELDAHFAVEAPGYEQTTAPMRRVKRQSIPTLQDLL